MAGGNAVISQCNLVFRKCFLWATAKFHCSFRAQDLLSKFSKALRAKRPRLPSAMSILHLIITATVFIHFTRMVHTSIMSP